MSSEKVYNVNFPNKFPDINPQRILPILIPTIQLKSIKINPNLLKYTNFSRKSPNIRTIMKSHINYNIRIHKFFCQSAAAFGEKSSWKIALKISKVCFQAFLVYFQVLLLVRGGLRREILVKNGILNSESAFFVKNEIV